MNLITTNNLNRTSISFKKQIQECKLGNRKAQAEIYQIFSGKLYGICIKYSNNNHEAKDNLQDSFITIFNKIDQFNNKGSFEGWLKRITVNTCLQKFRNKRMLNIVHEDIPEIVSVEVDEENISLDYLLLIIKDLPERYRMVFNLYVLDDYSHKEISEMLTISVGTSKSNLSRARVILRDRIETDQELKKKTVSNATK